MNCESVHSISARLMVSAMMVSACASSFFRFQVLSASALPFFFGYCAYHSLNREPLGAQDLLSVSVYVSVSVSVSGASFGCRLVVVWLSTGLHVGSKNPKPMNLLMFGSSSNMHIFRNILGSAGTRPFLSADAIHNETSWPFSESVNSAHFGLVIKRL